MAEAAVERIAADKVAPGVEFVGGGQRGVDQWAAEAARKHAVPFHLVLPTDLAPFTRDWLPADRASLERLMTLAASVELIDGRDELGSLAYDLRNEAVASGADALVVVWTGLRRGGTFQTMCAARVRGVLVEEMLMEGVGGQVSGARGF